MTHAYQEIYLSSAQAALGDAFDYAIHVCGVPGENFIKLFTVSSVSKHCAPFSYTNSGKKTSTRQARRVYIGFPEFWAARWRTCWRNKSEKKYGLLADGSGWKSVFFCAGR